MENIMHQEPVDCWQHQHSFNSNKQQIENRTAIVVTITFIMMIAEIIFGLITNSMALFADGVHMGTHAFALGISLVAYMLARRFAKNDNFNFGTWKIEILGAYSSALVLGIVALMMVYTSVGRLINPLIIHYNQALLIAFLGLVVNVVSAIILNTGLKLPGYDFVKPHGDTNTRIHHENADLNLKSAYLHVIADALTSIFAIMAILGAKYFSQTWLDPFMGIVGAVLITRWAAGLLKDSAKILLDYRSKPSLATEIRKRIESDGDTRISDLHIWKIADNNFACIISLVTGRNYLIEDFKKRLSHIPELAHITIEKNEKNNG